MATLEPPTLESTLDQIRRFVFHANLDVDTQLSVTNSKRDIVEEIHQILRTQKKAGSSQVIKTTTCKICGWEVLGPGAAKHLFKCAAKHEALKLSTPIPNEGATLREIKEFIKLHGLEIDATVLSKEELLATVQATMAERHGGRKVGRDPDTVECPNCGWRVLKPGYQQHMAKCCEQRANLKKVTPLPAADASLREIREFAQLHRLTSPKGQGGGGGGGGGVDVRLSPANTKAHMVEAMRRSLSSGLPSSPGGGGGSPLPAGALPPNMRKDREPATRHCDFCGWEVLVPGYAEHTRICQQKHASLKQTTAVPTAQSTLREVKQFAQLHALQGVDLKAPKAAVLAAVRAAVAAGGAGPARAAAVSGQGGHDPDSLPCALCGQQVLRPGFAKHRLKCAARQVALKGRTEAPTVDSSLRQIREYVQLHQLSEVDTKLSLRNSKADMVAAIAAAKRSSAHLDVELAGASKASGARSPPPRSKDPGTVRCDLCSWEVLKPGYPQHLEKCRKRVADLKASTPAPTSSSTLREVKEFVALHEMDIDIRLSATRTKEDVLRDVMAALEQGDYVVPGFSRSRQNSGHRSRQNSGHRSRQHSGRGGADSGADVGSGGASPKVPATPGSVGSVECKLCGWQILKPGFSQHFEKCTARQAALKERTPFPTEASTIREIREYAALYQVDIDSKLTTERKKPAILDDLRRALRMPSASEAAAAAQSEQASRAQRQRDPETARCDVCGWEVLRPGFALHAAKCQQRQADLRAAVPAPEEGASLREIKDFVQLHQLGVDTRLGAERTKADMLEEIAARLHELGRAVPGGGPGSAHGLASPQARASPQALASPQGLASPGGRSRDPETVHCDSCGWEVLKPGYAQHLLKCGEKVAHQRRTTPVPIVGDSLSDIRNFVNLHGLDVDCRMSSQRKKGHMIAEIAQAMSPVGRANSSSTSPPPAPPLRPYEALPRHGSPANDSPLPCEPGSQRDTPTPRSSRSQKSTPTPRGVPGTPGGAKPAWQSPKTAPSASKFDFAAWPGPDPTAAPPPPPSRTFHNFDPADSREGEARLHRAASGGIGYGTPGNWAGGGAAAAAAAAAAASPRSPGRDPQTERCPDCDREVLRPGYAEHRAKCRERALAQRAARRSKSPPPTASLRELREYAQLYGVAGAVDTRLANDRSKEDILRDIKRAVAANERREAAEREAAKRGAAAEAARRRVLNAVSREQLDMDGSAGPGGAEELCSPPLSKPGSVNGEEEEGR